MRASEPEESLLYTWSQPDGRAQVAADRLCGGKPVTIVRPSTERSAARLAHQSGGLGVPSSNLGAPTSYTLKALKQLIFLKTLTIHDGAAYTRRYIGARCGWSRYVKTRTETSALASAFATTCAKNTDSATGKRWRRSSSRMQRSRRGPSNKGSIVRRAAQSLCLLQRTHPARPAEWVSTKLHIILDAKANLAWALSRFFEYPLATCASAIRNKNMPPSSGRISFEKLRFALAPNAFLRGACLATTSHPSVVAARARAIEPPCAAPPLIA